jgi:hypothetical protein
MNTWQENSKLLELRAKTDRQLLELATRAMEAAMCFARAEEYHTRAERAANEVRRLLPCLSRNERRRFEARLFQLDEMLRPTARAACF